MSDLSPIVERAKSSEYFSGARLAADLERFLTNNGEDSRALGRDLRGVKHLFFVGSGGSLATLQTAKYILDGFLAVPSDAIHGYDLSWRSPTRLAEGAVAFFASYSGETEDTVAALRFARERGARTIGIVRDGESAIAREADDVIQYDSPAIFEAPIAALVLVGAGLAEGTSVAEVGEELAAALADVPAAVEEAVGGEEERAERRARDFLSSRHLYVLGSGPLAPLAYKVALTVVMENIRIGATWVDAAEFRHGPAEALERSQIDALMLLGTDASRPMAERSLAFLRQHGARVEVMDAAEYPHVHPLLTPLVLNSITQWFTVWSAILRGISDLDERVFMGRHVLATEGHAWP